LERFTWRLFEQSLVTRLGEAFAAIALMAVLGMSVSGMVALSTRGSGEAINLAGSLRMQSWKMASIYLALPAGDPALGREALRSAIVDFDTTLMSRPIAQMLPTSDEADLVASYNRVRADWRNQVRPLFAAAAAADAPLPSAAEEAAMQAEVTAFVADINLFVKQMERATESRILVLQMVLGVALVLTVLVVGLTVHLLHNGLVKPLHNLLGFASRVGRGDLTVRTEHTGEDELGRLGQAFNLMAEDLSKLYQDLESRVEQKTAELTRSNRSLELLYHSIARLHGAAPGQAAYTAVLKDIETVLGLGHGIVCLGEPGTRTGRAIASSMVAGDASPCDLADCALCHGTRTPRVSILADGRQLLTLPLSDIEHQYGVMVIDIPEGAHPEAWQVQLLEALSRHIGVAIGAEQRVEQGRRLALLEERAVIARELHDSLAQSLAYMKIQVSRLQAVLKDPQQQGEAGQVLAELRGGLSGAYRQLRELLSTFRLKMEQGDLRAVLAHTVEEFAARGGLPIGLDTSRLGCALTPNEEIHVLHVIREALSNVLNHARARMASVSLACRPDGRLEAVVEDDGAGIHKAADVHHYGMTIMEERARTLQGDIRYEERPGGGTRVVLSFRPASQRSTAGVFKVAIE